MCMFWFTVIISVNLTRIVTFRLTMHTVEEWYKNTSMQVCMSMQESGLTMADTYALKNVMSVTKDSSKEESTCTDFTIGEGIYQDVQSLDNEAPDNSVMNTGAKNSNQTITCATKTVNTTNPIAENYTSTKSCKRFICILVTITLVTTYTIALVCLAVLFYKIAQPQQTSSIVLLQLEQINKSLTSIQNQITILSREEMDNNAAQSNNIQQLNTSIDMQLSTLHNQTQQLSDSNTMLQQQLTTLHNQTQQLSDSNTMLQQQLTTLRNQTQQLSGRFFFNPASSCAALPPSSPSGYYWVRASNGSAVSVYCDMTLSCGGVTGGWMRVAELDMTNSSHQCPSGLMEHIYSGKCTCRINSTSADTCSSVIFPVNDLRFSQVCGKIIAYQFASPDAFGRHGNTFTIDENYVDGVSLTHGNPRHHIWTFAAATDELGSACPCISSNSNHFSSPPAFVGEDYFCDTASADDWEYIFYVDDPLWDGAGCGPQNTCCSFNDPPWFYKQLPQHTTDNIEMRVCRDQDRVDEDVAIEIIDMYIQ